VSAGSRHRAGRWIHLDDLGGDAGWCRLSEIEGIDVDLRYAGRDNFAGRVLYAGMDCAWLRREAAEGLARAAAWLAARRPGVRLRVLDALRPQRVQESIWAEVEGTPMAHYFAEPRRGSIHSFGMAVDVTLLHADGREADMGSGFDAMTPASHPALDAEHLALGTLSAAQLAERGWLYAAMARGGFHGIASEWWHFDHGDRDAVRRELARVR
jgi:zinc D-Ala-D-Ala dipeptidase